MYAQALPSSSKLMSNYMNALKHQPSERRASAPSTLSSPDSHPSAFADGSFDEALVPEMSPLLLPSVVDGSFLTDKPQLSSATVVSTSYSEVEEKDPPSFIITTTKSIKSGGNSKISRKSASSDRRHSIPSALMLSQSPLSEAVTRPVPEFLCHLFSMLRDPSLSNLISWSIPTHDEPDHLGGGMKGVGKIVVHNPEGLQDFVLGKYYRHSKYASFQRQLNYFGFKKRLHGGKKGKLSPCSFVHEKLGTEPQSLFQLKRRPPVKKRPSVEMTGDSSASVTSLGEKSDYIPTTPKSKKSRKVDSKKDVNKNEKDSGNKSASLHSIPIQVQAEEYVAPLTKNSTDQGKVLSSLTTINTNAQKSFQPEYQESSTLNKRNHPSKVTPVVEGCLSSTALVPSPTRQISVSSNTAAANRTASMAFDNTVLFDLLSTTLPPSEILFDDNSIVGLNEESTQGFHVTHGGRFMSTNSLVDLAMFY